MRSLSLIIILLAGISCIQKNKIPEGILSQEKMRRIMWDLIRTDVYVSDFLSKDSLINKEESRAKLYEQVYRLHSTNRIVFKNSLTFYQSRPDLLKVITDSLRVDERKANEEQHVSDEIQKKIQPKDSILVRPKRLLMSKEKPEQNSNKKE